MVQMQMGLIKWGTYGVRPETGETGETARRQQMQQGKTPGAQMGLIKWGTYGVRPETGETARRQLERQQMQQGKTPGAPPVARPRGASSRTCLPTPLTAGRLGALRSPSHGRK
jgi:hypothetical protein